MLNPQILPPMRDPEPEIPAPAIRVLESTDTYASVALEPLERGFATTVGNPLRRLLLSSIQGTAITWVKIDGVPHEYTVIPGVKEEVMDLLLSVKRIRIHAPHQAHRQDASGRNRRGPGLRRRHRHRQRLPDCQPGTAPGNPGQPRRGPLH